MHLPTYRPTYLLCIALNHITLHHCSTVYYLALHHLHCITFRYLALGYLHLHYIPLRCITLCTLYCMHTWVNSHIDRRPPAVSLCFAPQENGSGGCWLYTWPARWSHQGPLAVFCSCFRMFWSANDGYLRYQWEFDLTIMDGGWLKLLTILWGVSLLLRPGFNTWCQTGFKGLRITKTKWLT